MPRKSTAMSISTAMNRSSPAILSACGLPPPTNMTFGPSWSELNHTGAHGPGFCLGTLPCGGRFWAPEPANTVQAVPAHEPEAECAAVPITQEDAMAMITNYSEEAPSREEVDALPGATLVEFGTDWCGHCRAAQAPLQQAFAAHPELRHIKVEDGPGRRLGR